MGNEVGWAITLSESAGMKDSDRTAWGVLVSAPHDHWGIQRKKRRRRPKRSWPICPHTGKQRLGERKDAKILLQAAQHRRAHAEMNGRTSAWTVRRGYHCDYCRGWHLTTIETWNEKLDTHRS